METSPTERDRFMAYSRNPLYQNFYIFSILFSVVHATVDGVLAFAAAELGRLAGSYSGFTLYCVYTLTSLLVARPTLERVSSKWAVFLGLCGMLVYVSSFFIALLYSHQAFVVFVVGAVCGGFGAGMLWPGQGVYFSNVALSITDEYDQSDYSEDSTLELSAHSLQPASRRVSHEHVTGALSGIFAFCYLGLESVFKILATVVFVNYSSGQKGWRPIVFGIYTVSAVFAATLFCFVVNDVDKKKTIPTVSSTHRQNSVNINSDRKSHDQHLESVCKLCVDEPHVNSQDTVQLVSDGYEHSSKDKDLPFCLDFQACSSVIRLLYSSRLLQLLLPYQICFGLSTGLIDFYINKNIVAVYLGDGFIGLLSAISTIAAAVLSLCLALLANMTSHGKWKVMVFGGICFLIGPLLVLILPVQMIANWGFLVLFFIIHGAGRGIWESVNKSVVADYFICESERGTAFAAVYFTSGLAGAIGFIVFQFMSPMAIALLNVAAGMSAIIGYVFSDNMYRQQRDSKERGEWQSISTGSVHKSPIVTNARFD